MYAWAELAAFLIVVTALTPLLGGYMAGIFEAAPNLARRLGDPLERSIFRFCRIDAGCEMSWCTYLRATLTFSAASAIGLMLLLCMPGLLPLNPQHVGSLPPLPAFNIAVSFMTTTDWQAYSGESALSYLAQMAGLGWQNFTAAAVGLAVALAAIRGLARSHMQTLGNFWVDLTRSIVYVLLPLCIVGALAFVAQGTPQNFHAYQTVRTLESRQ